MTWESTTPQIDSKTVLKLILIRSGTNTFAGAARRMNGPKPLGGHIMGD